MRATGTGPQRHTIGCSPGLLWSDLGVEGECASQSVTGADVGVVRKCGKRVAPAVIYYRLLYLQGYARGHSFHSELQTLLRSASEHSLVCRPARGQLASPKGAPGSLERAAGSPDSLGRDTASLSKYPPPPPGNLGGGGTPQREAHIQETPEVFSPLPYTPWAVRRWKGCSEGHRQTSGRGTSRLHQTSAPSRTPPSTARRCRAC